MHLIQHINYDKHARSVSHEIGDQVLLQKETFSEDKSKKLQPRYEGPYKILEVQNPNCTIRYKRNKKLKVHFNKIKHYVASAHAHALERSMSVSERGALKFFHRSRSGLRFLKYLIFVNIFTIQPGCTEIIFA